MQIDYFNYAIGAYVAVDVIIYFFAPAYAYISFKFGISCKNIHHGSYKEVCK